MEEEERILQQSKSYAESKGLALNPDKKLLKAIISAIALNKREKGKPYCPCRAITGTREDEKIVCPCAFHLKEIEEDGHCRCKFFFKK